MKVKSDRIKRRYLLRFVVAGVVFLGILQFASAQTINIVGIGAADCRLFQSDLVNKADAENHYFYWAQGYMSGLLIRAPKGVDEKLQLTPTWYPMLRQAEFLREFCQANPRKTYADGVEALYKSLRNMK